MNKYLFTYLSVLTFLLYGCEKNTYFQSEKSVSKKIQKTWHLVRIAESQAPEDWIFSNGQVYRISTGTISRDTIDIGNYTIKTSLSDAFLTITNFKDLTAHLNTKFTIDQLDDKVLAIFGDDVINKGGTISREFTAN